MRKNLLAISVVSMTLLSLSVPVSASANNAASVKQTKKQNAKKKHHKLTQHEKDVLKLRKEILHPKKKSKSTPKQTTPKADKIVNGYDETSQKIIDMNAYINAATKQSIDKLNSFRNSQGLPSLTVDAGLTKIAQLRAQQTADQGFMKASHYDSSGKFMGAIDAQQLGIMSYDEANSVMSENIGVYSLDTLDDPSQLGNQSIQDEIDEGPEGGHYQNDVNSSITKCGVGFHVNSNGDIGYALDLE